VHPRRSEFCKNLFYDAVCPRADETAAARVITLESATLLCFCHPACRNLWIEPRREKSARAFDSVIDHFIDLSGMRGRHEIVEGGGLASVDAPPSPGVGNVHGVGHQPGSHVPLEIADRSPSRLEIADPIE